MLKYSNSLVDLYFCSYFALLGREIDKGLYIYILDIKYLVLYQQQQNNAKSNLFSIAIFWNLILLKIFSCLIYNLFDL